MPIDYWDHRILTGIINKRPLKSGLFTSYFSRRPPSDGEMFDLEIRTRSTKMLPSISNAAPGTMRQGDSTTALSIKAPRFRPKRAFYAADRYKKSPGVNPYAPQENVIERAIAEQMDMHREEIDFAIEIMCQQAMVLGKINLYDILEGGAPTLRCTIDYMRPEEHNIIVEGESIWSNPSSDLLGQVDAWGLQIQEETGFAATDLLLGKDAWTAFRRHKDVLDLLDVKDLTIGSLAPRIGKQLKGRWNGLNIWVVVGSYVDIDGSTKEYLDPSCALLLTSFAESVIEFGLPADNKCLGATEVFVKTWDQEDPSGTFTIAETRPLPWTKQPGWTVLATVLEA